MKGRECEKRGCENMEDEIYSDVILDLYKHPSNRGELEKRTVRLSGGNPLCGDEVQFDLLIEGQKIVDVLFNGSGCTISSAAESVVAELVKGKKVGEALALEKEALFAVIGEIMEARVKCALLGLFVVREGLRRWKETGETEVSGLRI